MKLPRHKKIFARLLRKRQTVTEKEVWDLLKNRQYKNLKFRRQHVIGKFIVDFYCDELKLAVEIDGGIHLSQENYDLWRQGLIEKKGIRFIRITNEDWIEYQRLLFKQIDNLLKNVKLKK